MDQELSRVYLDLKACRRSAAPVYHILLRRLCSGGFTSGDVPDR